MLKLGDKVRDKNRGMIGSIIGLEPVQGQTQRVFIQAEPLKGQGAGVPHIKVWQTVDQVELIDLSGNPVQGKAAAPSQPVTATGSKVDDHGHVMYGAMAGTGTNYDSAGNQIPLH